MSGSQAWTSVISQALRINTMIHSIDPTDQAPEAGGILLESAGLSITHGDDIDFIVAHCDIACGSTA